MSSLIFALAGPASTQTQEGPSPILNLLPILFIFLIFYFLLIKPQQKRQKDHQKVISSVKKNDEVITIGGIHGTVVSVKDKTFVLRIDENTKVEIEKNSIATVKKSRSAPDRQETSAT